MIIIPFIVPIKFDLVGSVKNLENWSGTHMTLSQFTLQEKNNLLSALDSYFNFKLNALQMNELSAFWMQSNFY